MPEVIINGPEGRLEARYMPAIDLTAPIALILHPEPNYGGNMNNRVSFAMYKLFQARGFSVMRFNFRGVGRSQGNYSGGEGELSDAATALDWIQSQCSGGPIMLDCRIFFRGINRHAADDAATGSCRLCIRHPACS